VLFIESLFKSGSSPRCECFQSAKNTSDFLISQTVQFQFKFRKGYRMASYKAIRLCIRSLPDDD
jgi:hypothetical protein